MESKISIIIDNLLLELNDNTELTLDVLRNILTSPPNPLDAALAKEVFSKIQEQNIRYAGQLKAITEDDLNKLFTIGAKEKLKQALNISLEGYTFSK